MNTSEFCEALKLGRRIQFQYSGKDRVVEVHAVGYTRDDNAIMRAWQVRGSSASEPSGWKLFRLDEIASARVLDEASEAPRSGYKKGDPALHRIVCEV